MDIEATMKVNALAKELVKKGIASGSEEASVLAEQMIQKKVIPKIPEKTEDVSEKYEILLERATRKLSRDIDILNEGVAKLAKQLAEIMEDVKRIKREQLTEIKKNPIQEQKKPEKQKKMKEKEEFSSKDVAVDKVFYFGKKE